MKFLLGVSMLFSSAVAGVAQAVVLHDQPLPIWQAGYSCSADSGVFGSFHLEHDSILQSGTFAFYGSVVEESRLNFTIWDEPYGNAIEAVTVHDGEYDMLADIPDTYWSTYRFPNWTLEAGSYWISIVRENGFLAWATSHTVGNDRHYFGPGRLNHPATNFGFSISGTIVPEPTSLAIFATVLFCGIPRRR
jgi:hypothetical protein